MSTSSQVVHGASHAAAGGREDSLGGIYTAPPGAGQEADRAPHHRQHTEVLALREDPVTSVFRAKALTTMVSLDRATPPKRQVVEPPVFEP